MEELLSEVVVIYGSPQHSQIVQYQPVLKTPVHSGLALQMIIEANNPTLLDKAINFTTIYSYGLMVFKTANKNWKIRSKSNIIRPLLKFPVK